MSASESTLRASAGDRLVIHGHRLEGPARGGEILEVSGEDGVPPYLVRWKDGHVSRLYPSSDSGAQDLEHGRSR